MNHEVAPMAVRANSLTDRVKQSSSDSSDRWSMTANDVRVLTRALAELGHDTDALLTATGLSQYDLNDPDVRIPCEVLGALVSAAQQSHFTPNLAVEVAQRTPMGAYPLLDYLVLTSDTVGAGVKQLARYFRLVGNPVTFAVVDSGDEVRVQFVSAAAQFSVEYVASLMVLHFRNETNGRFHVTSVNLRHVPDDLAGIQRALDCRVVAGSSWNGLSLPRAAWLLPLRRHDPVLRHMLESQANEVLARMPTRSGLADDVQRALASGLTSESTRIATLARRLGMSGRTLQRRLSGEGVSFQQLLDDVRKEAACRFISQPTLAICEVAYLVGYSEPAPFHRAFKRWYGMTPETFRQSLISSSAR
jgi:AraC-like DNA-binding protein